jgi:hypothetical protein
MKIHAKEMENIDFYHTLQLFLLPINIFKPGIEQHTVPYIISKKA